MGEKAGLTLPEGTKVAINSGSKIIYHNDYNKKNREIQLFGEAFFDVKHDPFLQKNDRLHQPPLSKGQAQPIIRSGFQSFL